MTLTTEMKRRSTIVIAVAVLVVLTVTVIVWDSGPGPATYLRVAQQLDVSSINGIERIKLPILRRGLSRNGTAIVDRRDPENTLVLFEQWVGKGGNFSGYLVVLSGGTAAQDVYIHKTVPRPELSDSGAWVAGDADVTPTEVRGVFEASFHLD